LGFFFFFFFILFFFFFLWGGVFVFFLGVFCFLFFFFFFFFLFFPPSASSPWACFLLVGHSPVHRFASSISARLLDRANCPQRTNRFRPVSSRFGGWVCATQFACSSLVPAARVGVAFAGQSTGCRATSLGLISSSRMTHCLGTAV